MSHLHRHIVFDCDGVLWQGTNEGYFHCYHRAAVDAGIHLDFDVARERILANWGKSARTEIEGMIPEHPKKVPEVLDRYRALVRSDLFLGTATLVPGTETTLAKLSETYALSAITGMNADNLKRLLARFHIGHRFLHAISTAETDDPDKQKATGYHLRELMAGEGLAPHEVLVVGDATTDVHMARSQGADIVVVLTGHLSEAEARQLGVTDILPAITDLPAWLQAGPHPSGNPWR